MIRLSAVLALAATACTGGPPDERAIPATGSRTDPRVSNIAPAAAVVPGDVADPPPTDTLLRAWTAAIDSGLRRWATPVAVYEGINDSLVPLPAGREVMDEATSQVDIHHSPSGRPVAAAEYPLSQSGDWSVGFVHYFDSQGRTRVFTSEARFFRGDQCGSGVVVETRRLVFDTAGAVVHAESGRADDQGHPVSADCRGYDWFAGQPVKTFGALLARSATRDSAP